MTSESLRLKMDDPQENECVIIREIYDTESASESFENDLENALESKAKYIVIEPLKLGDETARWIALGNCLHKTAVVCGTASLVTSSIFPKYVLYVGLPFGILSWTCAGIYALSWQFDPCCKYQPVSDSTKLTGFPLYAAQRLSTTAPMVLERKDDSRRKLLHNSAAVLSGMSCCWLIYKICLKSN